MLSNLNPGILKPYAMYAVVLISMSSTLQAYGQLRLSTGYEYSHGDYGQTLTTYENLIPLSLSWQQDDWQIKVSNGLIDSKGPANTASVSDGVVLEGEDESPVHHQGIMDTYLSVRKELPWGDGHGLFWDLSLTTRLSTASNDNIVERDPDYEVMVDLFWQQDRWLPMLSVGYKWLGEGEDISLDNVALFSLGAQYTLTDHCQLGAIFDYQQASSSISDSVQELMAYGACRIHSQWSISPYLMTGFTESSVDYGLGVQLVWRQE